MKNDQRSLIGQQWLNICLVFSVCLISTGCGNKYLKTGAKLEAVGDVEGASEQYLQALEKDATNADARVGLARNAPAALTRKAIRAEEAHRAGTFARAFREYEKVLVFKRRVEVFGIHLELEDAHLEFYRQARQVTLESLYARGQKLLKSEEYDDAEAAFDELIKISPDYRDAGELWNEAVYQQGVDLFNAQEWRQAYETFDRIGAYKDTKSYRKKILDRVHVTIALLPGEERYYSRTNPSERLYTSVMGNLVSRKDPFKSYIDRADVEGRSGADYRVKIKVIALEIPPPHIEETEQKKAWRWDGSREEYTDEDGKEKERAMEVTEKNYLQIKGRKRATLRVNVQVTEAATKSIVISEIFEANKSSQATYSQYSGDLSQLYRSDPRDNLRARKVDRSWFKKKDYASDKSLIGDCVKNLTPRAADLIAGIGY